MKHAIDYLRGKRVETIGLYAYPNLTRFYGNLGFRVDEDFSLMHTPKLSSVSAEALPKVETQNIQQIEKFDCRCFGGERKKLLESIILEEGNLSYYKSNGNDIVGYVAATVYETMAWVGPLTCQESNIEAAVTLLKAVLTKLTWQERLCRSTKKRNALAVTLSAAGFKEDFSVVRMFFGPNVSKNCIYLAESLERG